MEVFINLKKKEICLKNFFLCKKKKIKNRKSIVILLDIFRFYFFVLQIVLHNVWFELLEKKNVIFYLKLNLLIYLCLIAIVELFPAVSSEFDTGSYEGKV